MTAQFRAMQATGDTYYTSVVEDTTRGEIVAAASLIIERKFIHSAALVSSSHVVIPVAMRGAH